MSPHGLATFSGMIDLRARGFPYSVFFFALIWRPERARLHYLPSGCLQRLTDKRNDLVNNQDVPVSSLHPCGVCACVWYAHLLNCSQLTGWLFSPDWPQWLESVSWSCIVYFLVCVHVFFKSLKVTQMKVVVERAPLYLYKKIYNISVSLPTDAVSVAYWTQSLRGNMFWFNKLFTEACWSDLDIADYGLKKSS